MLTARSHRVVDVEGLLMFKEPTLPREIPSPLVHTTSVRRILRQLALCISLNVPPLLVGPPASGKTLLVEHVLSLIHPVSTRLIILHLADSALDPRSLFGSYQSSTSNPGQFEWRDGVLVKAMKEGQWILCKDLDKASPELLGTILPLVESFAFPKNTGAKPFVDAPGRGRIVASRNFRLFATFTTRPSSDVDTPATFIGSHKFLTVPVSPPSVDELQQIMDCRFPRLAGALNRVMHTIWQAMFNLRTASQPSIRHFEKLCRRCDELLSSAGISSDDVGRVEWNLDKLIANPSVREELWMDTRDVFLGQLGSLDLSKVLESQEIGNIATIFAVSSETCRYSLLERTPSYSLERDINDKMIALLVGRHRLPVSRQRRFDISPVRTFVFHPPALRLLSRIATCLVHMEPVLLVGETGTGKTSLVTHVASLLNQPLVSVNLSLQTEASELLGSLKPIDATFVGTNLYNTFLALFESSFSRKKNTKFEELLRKALLDKKWKRAVALWRQALNLALERQSNLNDE